MKKSTKSLLMIGICAAISTVIGFGASAAFVIWRPPCPGGFECLDVWAPVICSDGNVYSNSCYAARECVFGCVPWGGDIY